MGPCNGSYANGNSQRIMKGNGSQPIVRQPAVSEEHTTQPDAHTGRCCGRSQLVGDQVGWLDSPHLKVHLDALYS